MKNQCLHTKKNPITGFIECCQLKDGHTSPHLSAWLAWDDKNFVETYSQVVK